MKPQSVAYTIGLVSSQTGLSTHLIRAWERRYNAVRPNRSRSGRRLYSQSNVDRLNLLKQLVKKGHRISQIAGLSDAQLIELANGVSSPGKLEAAQPVAADSATVNKMVGNCVKAVSMLNGRKLYQMLQEAAFVFTRQDFLDKIIRSLMEEVGRRWSDGSLRIVHGQLAAVVVHAQLIGMLDHAAEETAGKPSLLIATPSGQRCYLGALAVAVTAQDQGWTPIFLGSNLPAEEIAAASSMLEPQMIALSITCRVNDRYMHDQLARLHSLIDGHCPLVIGGRVSHDYRRKDDGANGPIWATTKELISQLQ